MTSFARLIPVLMVVVLLFALLQAYTAIVCFYQGNYPFAGLYAALSIAGLAIARGLWVQRRNIRSRRQ